MSHSFTEQKIRGSLCPKLCKNQCQLEVPDDKAKDAQTHLRADRPAPCFPFFFFCLWLLFFKTLKCLYKLPSWKPGRINKNIQEAQEKPADGKEISFFSVYGRNQCSC